MHIPRIARNHITTDIIEKQYGNDKKEIENGFNEEIRFIKNINENYM